MFIEESDINQWKEDIKKQDAQRKASLRETNKAYFAKPVTWREVKLKEQEYHPILQKFSQEEKENGSKVKESETWKHKAEAQRKNIEKYLPEYNIITLDKDPTVPSKGEEKPKTRLQPSCQVDYNIITNQKLDDIYFQNVRLNVESKKKNDRKPLTGPSREFNIVSNKYIADHDNRIEDDQKKVEQELKDKYNKTHDYNCLNAEFYDKSKEEQFQEKRSKEQQDHGKNFAEKLPPTIRNRYIVVDKETIIFDPTREVPDAIKILDQKKKESMKKYEVRYKIEEQLKERDIAYQDKTEEMKLKRINDKKFTEHLDKGFDIITMNDYDKSQLPYAAKPVKSKWEKLRLTSNNPVQVQNPSKTTSEKVFLTSNDLKQTRGPESTTSHMQSPQLASNGRSASAFGFDMRSAGIDGTDGFNRQTDFSRMKEYKTDFQRAKEPVYNLADKYNQYCVPPKRVVDDFNTRTLPQIRVPDNSLKFSTLRTGGFKRAETSSMA